MVNYKTDFTLTGTEFSDLAPFGHNEEISSVPTDDVITKADRTPPLENDR